MTVSDEAPPTPEGRDAAAVERDRAAAARDATSTEEVGLEQAADDRLLAAADRVAAVRDLDEAASMRVAASLRDSAAQARDAASAWAGATREVAGDRVAAALDRHAAALQAATASAVEIAAEVRLATSQVVDEEEQVAGDRLLAAADRAAALLDRHEAGVMRAAALARDVAAGARDRASTEMARTQQGSASRVLAAGDRAAAAQDRQDAATDRLGAAVDLQRAYRDELTGALLRAPGDEQLGQAVDRAQRTSEPLVVVFLDVDNLKRCNDDHGHATGDLLLREVGTALRIGLRSYDVVVRYGGDEFVCALPGVSLDGARHRLGHVLELLQATAPQASVSYGLAQLDPDETAAQVVHRADADMYRRRRERGHSSASSS